MARRPMPPTLPYQMQLSLCRLTSKSGVAFLALILIARARANSTSFKIASFPSTSNCS